MAKRSAIIVGAGIVGLATARALAMRNYEVTVIERNQRATGASIRNFGMIWPIGQPNGEAYEQAVLSRNIWQQTCKGAGIWLDEVGSMHLAYTRDEMQVLTELSEMYRGRQFEQLTPAAATAKSPAVNGKNLLGALYSPHEMIVDPRQAINILPDWLFEQFGVKFLWGSAATEIRYPEVKAGSNTFTADEIYICSGSDFETLFPLVYSAQALTKCKLQMLKIRKQPDNWRIGPALCGGLSLLHYGSFKSAPSLKDLQSSFLQTHPEYLKSGIHVMVSQNQQGELIIGDSHEYGLTHDPFNSTEINEMILGYLKHFAMFRDDKVIETWNGVYPKLTNGQSSLVIFPEDGVTIINGLGGAGMTLSFGLCEQIVSHRTTLA